jgi:hypothetical protein
MTKLEDINSDTRRGKYQNLIDFSDVSEIIYFVLVILILILKLLVAINNTFF